MKFSLWPDSIKARVTLSALGVFLLSLWVLAFLTTQILERDISQLVADAQASATSQMAAQLDRELGSRLTALERIAAGINADMIENPDAVQHLLEAQPLLQDLFNVSVLALDKNGISIADYPYMVERIGVDYRVRVAAFAVALDEGRANIGNPLMAPTIGVPLIPLAVPIRDGSGEVIGALGGAIDLSKPNFFDAVSDENYGKKGLYSVVSRNLRTIVTSSDPSRIMLQLPSAGINPVLDRALVGEEGMDIYINEQGVKMLATVRQISAAAWFVAVMTPVTEAFAPIKDMQRRMILVVLAVTPLVGIIIWWLLQRQLRPILTTVDTLGQMTETLRPAQSLKLTGRKEVDNLIGAFNRLLEYLTGREQALQVSEDALRRQNVLFNVLLDNLAIGVFMVEAPSGKPLIANQAAQNLLGRGILPEASGENLSDVYRAQKVDSGESYPLTEMPIILGMSGHVSHVDDMLVERPDATKIQLEVFGTPVRNDNGEVWASLVSFYDITDRKRSEKKLLASHKELQAKNSLLDSLSKTDQLTGIANRRRTQQVIEQEIDRFNRYKKPFCIFLFDIDHFKAVNDTHGHEVGDQVLVELVRLVQSLIRRTDTLGRWGGEEFILVCPETSLPTAQTIADKICTTVREHEFAWGLSITLSIGVSEIQSGATLKEILVEVDRKMYLAKQKGRDRVES